MSWLELDRASLLVHVTAEARLDDVEARLVREGLTLGAAASTLTVGEWLGRGAPGARTPWLDPADHVVAGYTASFASRRVTIRPAPRRATGPDLFALLFGHAGALAALESAWLRVHKVDALIPRTAPFERSDPPWTPAEDALTRALLEKLREP